MSIGLKPATKFLKNPLGDQWEHVKSEIQEIEQALEEYLETPSKQNAEKVGEEIVDAQTSLETLLHKLGLSDDERDEIRRRVIEKNEKRGYFEDGAAPKIAGVGPDAI